MGLLPIQHHLRQHSLSHKAMKTICKTDANGDTCWYLNSKLHRENGPAIEHKDGSKEWFVNGVFHREDGPAASYANGQKLWFINGKLHRTDGPAIEYPSGYKKYFLNNKEYSFQEWDRLRKLVWML